MATAQHGESDSHRPAAGGCRVAPGGGVLPADPSAARAGRRVPHDLHAQADFAIGEAEAWRVSPPPDAAIAKLAARQYGLVTLRQLVGLGVGRGSIEHRVRVGRLHRLHRGVYAVGHRSLHPHARDLAAVLANGPKAVLSHRSAAALWGFMPEWKGDVDVSAALRSGRSRPGIAFHRTRRLESGDRAVHHGIPVMTPGRTVADLAAILDSKHLARAVNEVQVLGLATLPALCLAAASRVGSPGVAFLRTLLARDSGVTRSQLEDSFLSLIDGAGIARPEINARLGRFELDFLWRSRRVVVEVDGFAYHRTRSAFERDVSKTADLGAAGFRVLRFTSRNVSEEPLKVVARVGAALGPLGPDQLGS